MTRILPIQYQASLPMERLILSEAAVRRGDRDGRAVRGGGAGGTCGRDRACEAGQGRTAPSATSTSACSRRPARWASTASRAPIVNPRAFRELFPDVPESEWPFRQRVDREAVYLLTEGGSVKIPTPPHDEESRQLRRVPLRGRAAGWASGRKPWASTSSRASRRTRCWWRAPRVRGVRTTPTGLNRERRAR